MQQLFQGADGIQARQIFVQCQQQLLLQAGRHPRDRTHSIYGK